MIDLLYVKFICEQILNIVFISITRNIKTTEQKCWLQETAIELVQPIKI